eukprot:6178586-Pleurochrysis_carterae.AAC.6
MTNRKERDAIHGSATDISIISCYNIPTHRTRWLYDAKGSYIQTGMLHLPHGDAPQLPHVHEMATTVGAQAVVSTPTQHPPGRHTLSSGQLATPDVERAGGCEARLECKPRARGGEWEQWR